MPQTEDGIPAIVKLCIHAIEHKGGLESVGIYRVSGIKSEIDRLRVVLQPSLSLSCFICPQNNTDPSSHLPVLCVWPAQFD